MRNRPAVLLSAGLLILMIAGIWLAPRMISLYFQIKGGGIVEKILYAQDQENQSPIACELSPLAEPTTRAQTEKALQDLQTAVRYNLRNAQAYLQLGRAYCLLGEPEIAAQSYHFYTQIRPNNPLGYIELALAYEAACLRFSPEGEQTIRLSGQNPDKCSQGSEIQAASLQAWEAAGLTLDRMMDLGNSAASRKMYQDALQWYQRVTWFKPDSAEAWRQTARIYQAQGALDEAKQAYLKTVSLDAESRDDWYELGELYMTAKEWEPALRAFEKGLKASHGKIGLSNLYVRIGRLYHSLLPKHDFDKAWEAYEAALALDQFIDPVNQKANIHFYRGQLKARVQLWEDAYSEFQQAVELNPQYYMAKLNLGNALWKLGKTSEAKAVLQELITTSPNRKEAYRLMGGLYMEARNLDEAQAMYQKVLEIDPQDETARHALNALLSK